jgi:DNA-binding HxlR family transcriptional regulator
MSQMVQAVDSLLEEGRAQPAQLQGWLSANLPNLIGQQILVASVHAQSSPSVELPKVLRAWAAQSDDPTAAAAIEWLKEEYPGLLRAWLLSRVEELIEHELDQR